MEINANPSFNMFLEKDGAGDQEKILSDLDKYVKTRVASEAIRIVTVTIYTLIKYLQGVGNTDNEGIFEQVLPNQDGEDMTQYYVWN